MDTNPTVYICFGNPDHLAELEDAAAEGYACNWTLNPAAQPGDRVIFYLTKPDSSFVASGCVASDPILNEDEDSDWHGHYMADVEEIEILPSPIHIREARDAFSDKWKWLIQPRRSSAIPPDVVDPFFQMLNASNPKKHVHRRYWLTTQWPPTKDQSDNPPPHRHIWLKENTQSNGKTIAPGDRVLIYEAKKGKNYKRENADGSFDYMIAGNGRMGIVTVGEVVQRLLPNGRPKPDTYDDGSKKWWRWIAKTDHHNDTGFVPNETVHAIIGGHPYLLGLGGKSGLLELREEQYLKLVKLFTASSTPVPPSTPPAHGYGGGGESDAHKALKHYVALHPVKALGEKGLTLIDSEYSFRTGDKIDVLLKDVEGRPVAVEIELSQSAIQAEGFLQAIKYRALVCAWWDLPISSGRAVLVAHFLAPEIIQRCKNHGVEWHIIPKEALH